MSRANLIFLFCLFGSPLFLGCGGGQGGFQTKPNILVVGLEASPQALDPRVPADAYSARIFPLVFEALYVIGQNSDPQPQLVKSFEMLDQRTYLFHLKPGRRFADGSELTAHDAAYTYLSQAETALMSKREIVAKRFQEITAVDDHTLRIIVKEPYAAFFSDLTLEIIPEHADKQDRAAFQKAPFGSGPYKTSKFDPGGEVLLELNPAFNGPAPSFPRLLFRILPDDVTRIMALERGEVSLLLNNVPPEDVPAIKKNPHLNLIMEPGINSTYMGFNLEDPVLKDIRVRRAIAHAIDRDKLIGCFLLGTAVKADSILGPNHWAHNPNLNDYTYDPELSKRLLDEAGCKDPDGGGPLPRLTLSYKTSQNKARRWMAEALAGMLGEVGIAVEVRSFEFATFFADVVSGKFQIYSLTWVGIVEPDIYYHAFHSQSLPPSGKNRNRYANPEIDALAEQARVTLDQTERAEIYRRIQQILLADLPCLPLYYQNNIVALDRRISGFIIYPGGDFRSLATANFAE